MHSYLSSSLVESILQYSRYLGQLFEKDPLLKEEIINTLSIPYTQEAMHNLLNQAEQTETCLAFQMRVLRQKVVAKLICRDLLGLADLTEVVTTMSTLADVCILHGLNFLQQPHERYGEAVGEHSQEVQSLMVVGMGKLGGQELNVSSDIDLIFLYPEEGYTNGNRKISNHEYFSLIGKKLIHLLNDTTEMGFVFRVDMRLRPFGNSGPLVSSFAALEHYLLTHGREWERYAWIKGRVINQDDKGLYALIQPFVYRKYLDYSAYESMRELHKEIRREVCKKERQNNIKVGPGGIREIEFIAQVFQLIRGGRTPLLQEKSTQYVFNQLEKLGILSSSTIESLRQAYLFLRNLEHRLQYLDDAQTQDLPGHYEDQLLIAHSMGYENYTQFLQVLHHYRQNVTHYFEETFILSNAPTSDNAELAPSLRFYIEDPQVMKNTLITLGYTEVEEVWHFLSIFVHSPRYTNLSGKGKKRLERLLPALLKITATFSHPEKTLERLIRLIEKISRRESYLALLAEHPPILERLVKLYSQSPWVSDYLTQHPILLDELLNNTLLQEPPQWQEDAQALSYQLHTHQDDIEEQMNRLREFKHTQTFRLAVQDLTGLFTVEEISDHLSKLAETCLNATLDFAWQTLTPTPSHRPYFAIIAYGKLGGKELGYLSDLDLVFLYEDKATESQEIYSRFAKRIINWLTALTAAGQMYEIDLRLRPNGSSGLLVSLFSAFETYQVSTAWLWEHQALTRARFIAGDIEIGQRFETLRREILCKARDTEKLKQDIVQMRNKIDQTHPRITNSIKYGYGGLVDIEFIVQYLVLAYAHRVPHLTDNRGNIALLALAKEHQLIDPSLADQVATTYRKLRRLQHFLHLHNDSATGAQILEELQNGAHYVGLLWKSIFEEPFL